MTRLEFCPPLPAPCSARARTVARWFGLRRPKHRNMKCNGLDFDGIEALMPAPGQITLITGPSGSGKSTLLAALRARRDVSPGRCGWIDLDRLKLPARPLVNCFGAAPLPQVIRLLNRVGLSEAWSYLRTPGELSEGQRWRLRLALALHRAAPMMCGRDDAREAGTVSAPLLPAARSGPLTSCTIVCDEFAAVLDRVTACVIARSLRRAVSAAPELLRAVVATSHHDLIDALSPDLIVRCDFYRLDLLRCRPPQIASSTAATAQSAPAPRRSPAE